MRDDTDHLDRSLGFLLADSARLLRKRFDRRGRALGLTRAQWRVLSMMRRHAGINQTALADFLEIEPITLGRHIDRLEENGWAERRPDPDDRRAWRIYATDKAKPMLADFEALSDTVRDDALAGFTPAERERFIDDLIRVKSALAEALRRDAEAAATEAPAAKVAGGGRG